MPSAGSMGPRYLQNHKSLAEKVASKSGKRYSDVMNYIRCKLNIIMCIRSSLLCLRGSRTILDNQDKSGSDFGLHNLELNLEGRLKKVDLVSSYFPLCLYHHGCPVRLSNLFLYPLLYSCQNTNNRLE